MPGSVDQRQGSKDVAAVSRCGSRCVADRHAGGIGVTEAAERGREGAWLRDHNSGVERQDAQAEQPRMDHGANQYRAFAVR